MDSQYLSRNLENGRFKKFEFIMIKQLYAWILCVLSLAGCSEPNKQAPPDLNMVISVSSDGHYAIATNTNKQAILWDLKDHNYKIIFDDANIYSAYFIKNTDDFMYQNDKTNEVIVENVNGQIVKTFNPGFPTYGEALTSDLYTYAAADEALSVYKIDLHNNQKSILNRSWCLQDHQGQKYQGSGTSDCLNFISSNQLYNFAFTPDQKKLVGSNFFAFFIWDLQHDTGKMIQKNDAQTVAAISPDGSYVITGDLVGLGYLQNLKNLNQPGHKLDWMTTPDSQTSAFFNSKQNNAQQILTLKFIDAKHVLVFIAAFPQHFFFAVLYNPLSNKVIDKSWDGAYIKPIKYLALTRDASSNFYTTDNTPFITDTFSRDQAIDTSPSAHILVMSQQNANGIIVYQYDPEHQTLTQTWSAAVTPPKKWLW